MSTVQLYLYEVSQGKVAEFSNALLGEHLDGLWYATLVVFGKEFFYGAGICKSAPEKTPFGIPAKKITLGETGLPEDVFNDFLYENRHNFQKQNFNLYTQRTRQGFVETCLDFLVGSASLSSFIPDFPDHAFTTIFGEEIRQYVDPIQKKVLSGSHSIFDAPVPQQAGPATTHIPQQQNPPNPQGAQTQQVNKNVSNAMIEEFRIFRPNTLDLCQFQGINFPGLLKNIETTIQDFPLVSQVEPFKFYKRFAENQDCLNKFINDDKIAFVNWIFETVSYIGLSEKTLGLLDLLRYLAADKNYIEIVLKNEDKFYEIFRFLDQSEEDLAQLPKNLKIVLLKLLANATASEKCKIFFGHNLVPFTELILRAGRVYREDQPSFRVVLGIFINLGQIFSDNSNWSLMAGKVAELILSAFGQWEEKEILISMLMILCRVCFFENNLKNEVKEKIDRAKLAKLEFLGDQTLEKLSRDLQQILGF